MPQTASSFFSAYPSLAAFMMLIQSVNDLIPHKIKSYLYSIFQYFFTPLNSTLNSTLTLVFDEQCGMTRSQVYEAAEIYLRTKISPKTECLKVSKSPRQKHSPSPPKKAKKLWMFSEISVSSGGCVEPKEKYCGEQRSFELSFNKKFKDKVVDCYLPHVMSKAKEIKQQEKVVKLYNGEYCMFETLSMDAGINKMIIDDLERFVKRKEFYKKVGKVWKRGYFLYGPPGTRKSSLIAALANYLKFDVYDLELMSIDSNSTLRRVLLSIPNRSILVIEDVDCSGEYEASKNKLTLLGLLNFIDGLWSSCDDERIFMFTTNHKDRLDPALLRPSRMDVHINLSYCTVDRFKLLASNYLGDNSKCHPLWRN